jgi:hypothetical protein
MAVKLVPLNTLEPKVGGVEDQKDILVNAIQLRNALSPTFVIPLGKTIEFNKEHPENVLLLIIVNPEGNLIFVNPQFSKAFVPIVKILLGNIILPIRLVQPLNSELFNKVNPIK